MELCQFLTNTAAFSAQVDIVFKVHEIWMFFKFYYFPLFLISNYGIDRYDCEHDGSHQEGFCGILHGIE